MGGWSGTVETTLPLNIVQHNTMGIPAHLHSTVTGGMTVAFMGFAYYLVPLLTRRALWGGKLAAVQIYGYCAGLAVMIPGQTAVLIGVPRRTQSASYGDGLPSGWDASMNFAGVGVALAAATGGLFIVIMVLSLVAGKRTTEPDELVPSGAR